MLNSLIDLRRYRCFTSYEIRNRRSTRAPGDEHPDHAHVPLLTADAASNSSPFEKHLFFEALQEPASSPQDQRLTEAG